MTMALLELRKRFVKTNITIGPKMGAGQMPVTLP